MTANGITTKSTSVLDLPPGHPGKPYIIPSLSGEIIYIPCSKSATRLLVTGKETDNAFAVVGSGGTESAPIGFHYHNDAHDVFLCIKGQVNVWADDRCRTLTPGDFASVPPGTVHQYQILGSHTEFLGLIVPGGWEEFFRFIGEPYVAGPLFPLDDERNPYEVLIPKLKAAAERFDMVPCPRHPSVSPQPWEAGDNVLPGAPAPYFLRNNTGPAFLVGDTIVRPLAGAHESAGRFSIASIEGSSFYRSNESPSWSSSPSSLMFTFVRTHHCFQVAEGRIKFTLHHNRDKNGSDDKSTSVSSPSSSSSSSESLSPSSSSSSTLHPGETIYIPSNTAFTLQWSDRFAKLYAFANRAGLAELLMKLGRKCEGTSPPFLLPELSLATEPSKIPEADLSALEQEFGVEIR